MEQDEGLNTPLEVELGKSSKLGEGKEKCLGFQFRYWRGAQRWSGPSLEARGPTGELWRESSASQPRPEAACGGPGAGAFCMSSNGYTSCASAPRIPPDKRIFTTRHTPSCLFQDVDER